MTVGHCQGLQMTKKVMYVTEERFVYIRFPLSYLNSHLKITNHSQLLQLWNYHSHQHTVFSTFGIGFYCQPNISATITFNAGKMCTRVIRLYECNCTQSTSIRSCPAKCGVVKSETTTKSSSPCSSHSTNLY